MSMDEYVQKNLTFLFCDLFNVFLSTAKRGNKRHGSVCLFVRPVNVKVKIKEGTIWEGTTKIRHFHC